MRVAAFEDDACFGACNKEGSAAVNRVQPLEIQIGAHTVFTCYLNAGSKDTLVEIRLTSGAELKVKAVCLFKLTTLQVIEGRKNEAARSHQGVSTGLGSIGSLGWVLASSVVIGAVEGVLSANAAAHGKDAFTSAIELEMKLRNEGVFMPVGVIANIQHPLLSIWVAPGETKIGKSIFQDSYVHNGEDFLTVQTDNGEVRSIRWSTVESYAYQK